MTKEVNKDFETLPVASRGVVATLQSSLAVFTSNVYNQDALSEVIKDYEKMSSDDNCTANFQDLISALGKLIDGYKNVAAKEELLKSTDFLNTINIISHTFTPEVFTNDVKEAVLKNVDEQKAALGKLASNHALIKEKVGKIEAREKEIKSLEKKLEDVNKEDGPNALNIHNSLKGLALDKSAKDNDIATLDTAIKEFGQCKSLDIESMKQFSHIVKKDQSIQVSLSDCQKEKEDIKGGINALKDNLKDINFNLELDEILNAISQEINKIKGTIFDYLSSGLPKSFDPIVEKLNEKHQEPNSQYTIFEAAFKALDINKNNKNNFTCEKFYEYIFFNQLNDYKGILLSKQSLNWQRGDQMGYGDQMGDGEQMDDGDQMGYRKILLSKQSLNGQQGEQMRDDLDTKFNELLQYYANNSNKRLMLSQLRDHIENSKNLFLRELAKIKKDCEKNLELLKKDIADSGEFFQYLEKYDFKENIDIKKFDQFIEKYSIKVCDKLLKEYSPKLINYWNKEAKVSAVELEKALGSNRENSFVLLFLGLEVSAKNKKIIPTNSSVDNTNRLEKLLRCKDKKEVLNFLKYEKESLQSKVDTLDTQLNSKNKQLIQAYKEDEKSKGSKIANLEKEIDEKTKLLIKEKEVTNKELDSLNKEQEDLFALFGEDREYINDELSEKKKKNTEEKIKKLEAVQKYFGINLEELDAKQKEAEASKALEEYKNLCQEVKNSQENLAKYKEAVKKAQAADAKWTSLTFEGNFMSKEDVEMAVKHLEERIKGIELLSFEVLKKADALGASVDQKGLCNKAKVLIEEKISKIENAIKGGDKTEEASLSGLKFELGLNGLMSAEIAKQDEIAKNTAEDSDLIKQGKDILQKISKLEIKKFKIVSSASEEYSGKKMPDESYVKVISELEKVGSEIEILQKQYDNAKLQSQAISGKLQSQVISGKEQSQAVADKKNVSNNDFIKLIKNSSSLVEAYQKTSVLRKVQPAPGQLKFLKKLDENKIFPKLKEQFLAQLEGVGGNLAKDDAIELFGDMCEGKIKEIGLLAEYKAIPETAE